MDAVKPLKGFLVKFHKPLGIVTLVIALVHANLAFTNISPSLTGTLTFLTMLIVVVFGILMHFKKIELKNVKTHRFMSILIVVLITLHVFYHMFSCKLKCICYTYLDEILKKEVWSHFLLSF